MSETFDRNSGLGASEAAAACDLNPHTTALALYLQKIGQLPSMEENEAMYWGKQFEPLVLKHFFERSNKHPVAMQRRHHHSEIPWLWATPDADLDCGELVDAKTSGRWSMDKWGDEDTDEMPQEYIVQMQTQLACANAIRVFVPVLLAGQEMRVFRVERNERFISALLPRLAEFWERVQLRKPPEPDWGHGSTPDLIRKMYGLDPSKVVDLGDQAHVFKEATENLAELEDMARSDREEATSWADIYKSLGQIESKAKKDRERVKCQILAAMGEASVGNLPDGRRCYRKSVTVKAYSVPARVDVRFSVK